MAISRILENEIKIVQPLLNQSKNGVNIRILIKDDPKNVGDNYFNEGNGILNPILGRPQSIQMQNLKSGLHNRLTTSIADSGSAFTIETKRQQQIQQHENIINERDFAPKAAANNMKPQ